MGATTNQKLIEKQFDTSKLDFAGKLNPQQQDRFFYLVRGRSVLMNNIRFVDMPRPQMEINKFHIGRPITKQSTENVDPGTTTEAGKANKVSLNVKGIRSDWDITRQMLERNIEQENFEDSLMMNMTKRIGIDIEMLLLRGDSSISGSDALSNLLKVTDGVEKLSNESHVVDAGGDNINKNLLAEALRVMPDEYRNDPDLVFIMSDSIATDWMSLISARATALGDSALQGSNVLSAFGREFLQVPLMSDDLALSLTEGLPAELSGSEFGPFQINSDGSNDTLNLNITVNGAASGTLPIVFNHGVLEAVRVVNSINNVLDNNNVDARAFTDGEGRIVIRTNQNGSNNSITVESGSTAAATLGIDGSGLPNTVSGVDSGTAGNINEGANIILTNPMNIILGMHRATTVSSEFKPRLNKIENTVHNELDIAIENPDAMVKIENVRRQSI